MRQLGFVCVLLSTFNKNVFDCLYIEKKIKLMGENLSIVTRLEPTSEHHLCDARIA